MGPKTSRDLPEPMPRGDEERDTRQGIVEDAAENDGKHRVLSTETAAPWISR
jgi:hypothetical protein